jgi:four helix bundle protein
MSAEAGGQSQGHEFGDRFLGLAVDVVRFLGTLKRSYITAHIGKQLLRAATSMGANYEESRGAESRADFVHKLQVVLKESREAIFWLRVLHRAAIGDTATVARLLSECRQLSKIVGSSIVTAKSRLAANET